MRFLKENRYSEHLLPVSFLVIQIILVAVCFQQSGLFTPRVTPDSQSYDTFLFDTFLEILSQIRTPGYPVFLQVVKFFSIPIPIAQYLVYAGAVVLFYVALIQLIESKWRCAILAGILLHSNILLNHVSEIGTDCFSAALGIIMMGLLIMRQTMRDKWSLFLILGFAAFGMWFVRPAYLFVVVLIPTLGGGLLLACRNLPINNIKPTTLFREVVVLSMLCLIPFVAYSTVRFCVVGHFGVVSFGGYGIEGIAGQFLVKQDIKKLPKRLRPLAAAVLEKQKSVLSLQPITGGNGRLQYMPMEENYDIILYKVFLPVAKKMYGDAPPLINTKAKQLAFQTILLHKKTYAEWLYCASRRALDKVFIDFFWNKINKAMAMALLVLTIINILWRSNRTEASSSFLTRLLFLVAVFYYTWSMVLVVLVEKSMGRYTNAVNIFIPLVIGSLLIDQWNFFRNSRYNSKRFSNRTA